MNILLLNQYFPPDLASTGQFLDDVARALERRGHKVRVVCSKGAYYKNGSRPALNESGIEVWRVPGSSFGRKSLLGRTLDYFSFYIMASLCVLFGPRPDVIVTLTTPPYIGLIGAALRRLRGVRHIHWVMDLYPDAMVAHGMLKPGGPTCRILKWLTRRLLKSADAIWVLGPFAREKALAYLDPEDAHKIETVPLWADPAIRPMDSEASSMRAEYSANGSCMAMYSGNLGLGHDFSTFLDGAGRLLDTPGVRFLFVGGGTRWESARSAVHERQLHNVGFAPYAPRERLNESLAAADVHLISQLPAWQGIIVPSKISGILAAGRPVIFVGAHDNEIAQWIREAHAGYVIAPGDGAGLAQALERLSRDPDLQARLGRNGRAFYERHLAGDVNMAKLIASVEHGRPEPLKRPALEEADRPVHSRVCLLPDVEGSEFMGIWIAADPEFENGAAAREPLEYAATVAKNEKAESQ